eukprot:11189681-Alexandrium_andersonii.AAC.1
MAIFGSSAFHSQRPMPARALRAAACAPRVLLRCASEGGSRGGAGRRRPERDSHSAGRSRLASRGSPSGSSMRRSAAACRWVLLR